MKYLKIENQGNLDIRLIALMGGTTKENDVHKIGHFGTGLKYTFAFLFRNKINFKIFIDGKEVKMSLDTEVIGEETFEIICINGHRTSITTKMGREWKAWMIIREIYSNALDEGGCKCELTEEFELKENTTQFYIEATPGILEVWNSWNDFFIVGKEPFYEDKKVKIFPQSGCLKVYKQGILIKALKNQNSLFAYDLKDAQINEMREYGGYLESDISRAIVGITDKKVIQYFIENLKDDHYESTIDFSGWSADFNKQWKESLEGTKIIHEEAMKAIEARGIKIDTVSNIVVPENLYKGLTRSFEGIGALRVSKAVNDFFEIYNDRLSDRVKKAQKLLENADYFIEPELSFIFGCFGDKRVNAKVDLDTKKIYISEKLLDTDLFTICTILVEENEHFKTGLSDETREFQQHFIDLYTNQIIEKAKCDLIQ